MASDIADLREYLFDTIEAVRKKQIDVETAKAVAQLASEITKTAKLEIDYSKFFGKKNVIFIDNNN